MKSAFQDHFALIPQVHRPRSQFRRVSRHKTTFDEGQLIPFYLDEVLPGDTFNVRASMFARLATPIFPLMDNMYLETFWFFCPNRLVWDNFQKQHGEQKNPGDSTDYTTPVINSVGTPAVMSLWDQFGLPMVRSSDQTEISALPFRMYSLIWNEWFRDQDLQNSLNVPTGDGPDALGTFQLQYINKFKDFFTTCRPAPQKGPSIEVPIGGTVPVWGSSGIPNSLTPNESPIAAWYADRATTDGSWTGRLGNTGQAAAVQNSGWSGNAINEGLAWRGTYTGSGNRVASTSDMVFLNETASKAVNSNAVAPFQGDLNQAFGPTINAFREAVTVQQAYELDMRGGSRYIEMIFNHYGVVNPDFRLQRPEFLGHQRSMVNIHPVAQTSATDSGGTETPQGNLAAFGTVASQGNGFVKSFTEFGYVIGLMAVRADLAYQEKVDAHWTRRTRFDYYYPNFSNIGEQAVLNREIQVNPLANTDNDAVLVIRKRGLNTALRRRTSRVCSVLPLRSR